MVFKKGQKSWNKGLTYSLEKNKGKNNPNWKGNAVQYAGLHSWIKRHKPKPNICEDCKKNKPYDLANISGKYLRDIADYKWICRRCHMIKDNRLYNLSKISKLKKNKTFEEIYGKEKSKQIKSKISKSNKGRKRKFTKEHLKNLKIGQQRRRKWEWNYMN